jgi:hypothetical protein
VKGITHQLGRFFGIAFVWATTGYGLEEQAATPAGAEIIISVADQRLALIRDGGLIKKFPISTSKFGLGDSWGSYKTPIGRHRVYEKIGDDLVMGAVMKRRHATGEILPVNAPGRDPIVTRILWLEGLESQNSNAKSRGIYIHGTVEEDRIGKAVSYGCIRMRSKDVVELFEQTPTGTEVNIIAGKLPRLRKSAPEPEVILVKAERPKALSDAHGNLMAKVSRRGADPEPAKPQRVLFASKADATARPTRLEVAPPKQTTSVVGPLVATNRSSAGASPIRRALTSGRTALVAADQEVELAMTRGMAESGVPKGPVAEPASATLHLALALGPEFSDHLLATLDAQRPDLSIDAFSKQLLHPPAPQFRLAFRASLPGTWAAPVPR